MKYCDGVSGLMSLSKPVNNINVVIRTKNSEKTLSKVLSCINDAHDINARFILIDDGSIDSTLELVLQNTVVLDYSLPEFNYAMALNIAIPFLSSDYTLIISSHTVLQNPEALRYGIGCLMSRPTIAAVCFSSGNIGELTHSLIDKKSFTGWNGAWNTCSLFRTDLLRLRPFNPDVFSAEDQEWSRWAMEHRGCEIAHVDGCGMLNLNHRKEDIRKRLNEWACIGYFVAPNYQSIGFLFSTFLKRVVLRRCLCVQDRLFWLRVVLVLLRGRYKKPIGKSRYFK